MVRQRRYDAMDSSSQFGNYPSPQSSKQGPVNRFEYGRPSLQSRSSLLQSKVINIYTNGERYKNDRKFQVLVSHKLIPSLDKLYKEIEEKKAKINNSVVQCLYTWPDGKLVESMNEIEENPKSTIYVCSDKKTKLYKDGNYGNIQFTGSSAGGSAFTEKYSRNSEKYGGQSNTLHVTSAHTGEAVSLFMDRKSQQPYEGLLENIRGMFGDKHPKIVTLYTMSKHPKKINSLSAIRRALEGNEDNFWACGENDEPGNKMSRNASPKRNGVKEKQKNGDRHRQNGHHDDRDSQSNGRQSNGHTDSQGRSYQRYQEEYDDEYINQDEESDQEPSSPPSRRHVRSQDKSPKRDNRKEPNQRRRFDEDDSPRRDSRQAANHRKQGRGDDYDDDEEEDHNNKSSRHKTEKQKPSRREQTPPRKERNNSNKSDGNSDEEDDDEDLDKKYDHPSDEEIQERIDEMSQPDNDQDKNIRY